MMRQLLFAPMKPRKRVVMSYLTRAAARLNLIAKFDLRHGQDSHRGIAANIGLRALLKDAAF
jgi:hypothetical protein